MSSGDNRNQTRRDGSTVRPGSQGHTTRDSGRTPPQQQQPEPDLHPHDLGAEEGVLGSLLLTPDVIDEIADSLSPEDFYADEHRWIYQEMLDTMNHGRRTDVTLLAERLRAAGKLELIGGPAKLAKLFSAVPNSAHVRWYAAVVRDKALIRNVIIAGMEAVRIAGEAGTRPATEVVEECETVMYRAAERGLVAEARPQNMAEMLAAALEEITARCEGRTRNGIATGYHALDDMLGGLKLREVSIVGGRPGHGKTSLGTAIALRAGVAQHKTLVISLEMAATELVERMLSAQCRIDLHRMRTGHLTHNQRGLIASEAGRMNDYTVWVEDCPQRTSMQIGAIARRHKRRSGGLDLLIVDYLQLIHPDNERDPRQEQIAKISRRMKILARELDAHVMLLAQVNRNAGEVGRAPKLSELRESGAIEQDADVVIFVHRPAEYDPAQRPENPWEAEAAEIHVAKHRNGPTGVVNVHWFRPCARFDNPATEAEEAAAPAQAPPEHEFPPLPAPPPQPPTLRTFF